MRSQCSNKYGHDIDVSELKKKEAIKINFLLLNFLKIHVGIIIFYNFPVVLSGNILTNLSSQNKRMRYHRRRHLSNKSYIKSR